VIAHGLSTHYVFVIHSSVYGHLGYFYVSAVVNSAAMNMMLSEKSQTQKDKYCMITCKRNKIVQTHRSRKQSSGGSGICWSKGTKFQCCEMTEFWRPVHSKVTMVNDIVLYICSLPRGWISSALTAHKERKW